MTPFKHILVSTDFSEQANRAIDVAVTLASEVGARLTLLHVLEPVPAVAERIMPTTAVTRGAADVRRAADQALAGLADARLRGLPKSGTALTEEAHPALGIVEYAKRNDVDLIVIASHGRTGLERFFLGSVAERVVRLAACSVYTVKS